MRNKPLDVMLCDIKLPFMSGIDVARELYNMKSDVKVVFLSAYREFDFAKQAMTYGVKDDEREFKIIMHHCPSKGRLIAYGHIRPYRDYCKHCDLMYRRVLEPLGYKYSIDLSDSDKARCSIRVRKEVKE